MQLLSLDLATNTGVAYGPSDRLHGPTMLTSIALTPNNRGRAYLELSEALAGHVALNPTDFIVAEATLPPMHAAGHTTADTIRFLCGLLAVVELFGKQRSITVDTYPVQKARTQFIGGQSFLYKGQLIVAIGSMKGVVAKFCAGERLRRLGHNPKNDDESDAGALWYAYRQHLHPEMAFKDSPLNDKTRRAQGT